MVGEAGSGLGVDGSLVVGAATNTTSSCGLLVSGVSAL